MVYFIRGTQTGRIKIGYTDSDPQRRLRQLQTGSPEPLELVAVRDGDQQTEAQIHCSCAASRLHGEWFAPSPAVQAAVDYARTHPATKTGRRFQRERLELELAATCGRQEERKRQELEYVWSRQERVDRGECGLGHRHGSSLSAVRCDQKRQGWMYRNEPDAVSERRRARHVDRQRREREHRERQAYLNANPDVKAAQERLLVRCAWASGLAALAAVAIAAVFAVRAVDAAPYRDLHTLTLALAPRVVSSGEGLTIAGCRSISAQTNVAMDVAPSGPADETPPGTSWEAQYLFGDSPPAGALYAECELNGTASGSWGTTEPNEQVVVRCTRRSSTTDTCASSTNAAYTQCPTATDILYQPQKPCRVFGDVYGQTARYSVVLAGDGKSFRVAARGSVRVESSPVPGL